MQLISLLAIRRMGKSTSEPLFCVRRLQDIAEAGHQNKILFFLEWEKAFDKIIHMRLVGSLERMRIDSKMISNIKALYEHSFFKTPRNDIESEWKKQHSGIRQGCPLSPYFLFMMMNVLFFDVKRKNNEKQ